MKKHSLLMTLGICCGAGLMHGAAYAEGGLTAAQLDAIVKTDVVSCGAQSGLAKIDATGGRIDPASIIPASNAREFPKDRIAKTLNGIWRGQVLGDDGEVSVDYFWIMDTHRGESLIIAQRTGKQSVAAPQSDATRPQLKFLLCPHEGYVPGKVVPQIHAFVKVSDDIKDAQRILETATGQKLATLQSRLSDLWRGLVATGYFSHAPAIAFAGGFFKPIKIEHVARATGPGLTAMSWEAEYRGGGSTKVKFQTGVPMLGIEHGQFVGTTASSGDYLVASPGNGSVWKTEAASAVPGSRAVQAAGDYALAFDKVVLGPLQ